MLSTLPDSGSRTCASAFPAGAQVRHRETQRDTERHRETQRDTERHRETQRDTERHHRETQRDLDKLDQVHERIADAGAAREERLLLHGRHRR
eukprot:COSAG03_NODE_7288_length_938_cov_110.220501_1_plen_92_part_10